MKFIYKLAILTMAILFTTCTNEMVKYGSYEEYPVYDGNLGLTYGKEKSRFRIWAPTAEDVKLRFYAQDLGGKPTLETPMKRDGQGSWQATFNENLEGKYYTFEAKVDGKWLGETPDPYVKAVGTNGKRGQVIDFSKTNPEGWLTHSKPALQNPTDIILYELHIRDLSTDESSEFENRGKFLGLAETGKKNAAGLSTGLDHIKEMGVTHVHLLPSYDYKSIDESNLEAQKFNWGYDPQNYNVPEGGYSTNPTDGATRIREFKTMVKTLHDNGLRVVMDVVYNHTFDTNTPFEQLVPGYYYRKNEDGTWSNASGCGNETASERLMMRKYIIESVKYWAQEYHIDGFRFDLMGIHDIETMNQIAKELHKIDPTIVVYGEGWTAGGSPLPDSLRALKHNTLKLEGVAAFSDDLRDGAKGHVFTHDAKAFVSGEPGFKETIKFGVIAATRHPQVDYSQVNYSKNPWAREPSQCINYVSCHDNHTLWDRLENCCKDASKEDRISMHKLANTIVLTSQGIPFLHAGVEMLRTKQGVENSYESPDSINQINWNWKTENQEVVEYYKNLIALRKNHPAFRMTSNAQIQEHLNFFDFKAENMVGYQISNNANGDSWKNILVYFNGHSSDHNFNLPAGNWQSVVKDGKIDENGIGKTMTGNVNIAKHSALVLVQ